MKTSIITSMYNKRTSTIRLIDNLFFPSLINNASKDAELIILDDASPLEKETKALVERHYPNLKRLFGRVVFIRNNKNLGFSGSFNKGIRLAKGKNLLIANDDIYLPKGSVSLLINTLSENDRYGLIGPITNEKDVWTYQYCKQAPRIRSYSNKETRRVEQFAALSKRLMKGKRVKTDALCGFCIAVRSSTLKKHGLFDESFGYGLYEDTDLVRRVSRNHDIIVNPEVFVYHGGTEGSHASIMQHPIKASFSMIRNTLLYAKKAGYSATLRHVLHGIHRSTGRHTCSQLFEEALSENK